jgi:hypothetical protein
MRTFANVSVRLFAAVLAVASLAPVAKAQNTGFAAKVNVPFAFETSSGQHFPAGVYTISSNGLQSVEIGNATTHGLILCQAANQGLEVTQGKAVFTHYGSMYYLRSVSVADSSTKMLFSTSKQEKESQIASGKAHTTVELALLQASR